MRAKYGVEILDYYIGQSLVALTTLEGITENYKALKWCQFRPVLIA